MNQPLKIALPSKGSLGQTTIDFLFECGFNVRRKTDRQYTGTIKGYNIDILFQRAEDIPQKVREGVTHLGITGLDIVEENKSENDIVKIVFPQLDYGKANLVIAVPESWIHITNLYDLADLTAKWRLNSNPKYLRIATKFKKLTEKFLHNNNIYNYKLVEVSGVLEVAPKLNIADIIVDLTSSGTTLKENHLKEVDGGVVLNSEACLIGNSLLFTDEGKAYQPMVELLIDKIESHLRAKDYFRITTNIECINPELIEQEIQDALYEEGIDYQSFMLSQSLSLSKKKKSVINVSLITQSKNQYNLVRILRKYHAQEIASTKIDYFFLGESQYYQNSFHKTNTKKE
ncbi:MAG: ATP phosphoribosyltransferase [Spirochaetota bacterium]|nr:ATP phosphoribosyltransferase [Spirochaetota bacterium]